MIGTKHENDKNTFSGQQKRVQAVEGIVKQLKNVFGSARNIANNVHFLSDQHSNKILVERNF